LYLLARHQKGTVKAQSDAEEAQWVPFEKIAQLETHPYLKVLLKKAMQQL
jgi:hypothetical protein